MISEQVEFERLNAKKIPLTAQRCFHPIRIYNKYLNEYLYVNCRKCDGCLSARSAELTSRVENECKQHKFSLFFTLTYDNEHLPVMRWHSGNLFLGNRPIGYDKETDNYIYPSIDVTELVENGDFDLPELVPTNYNDSTCFAYCNKYDVQKFIMRLRSHIARNLEWKYLKVNNKVVRTLQECDDIKNLSKDEKKVRYFICAEYGPAHFRPHYHGIIWTDCEQIARYLERNILEDWSLGSKTLDKPSYVNGAAPSYVAKYVNGSTRLPKVLQSEPFCSFLMASKNPIIGSFKSDLLQMSDALVNGVVEQLQPIDRKDPSILGFVPISTALCNRYFPKCQSWSNTDDFGKLAIIEKYRKNAPTPHKELKPGTNKSFVFKDSCLFGYDYLVNDIAYKRKDARFVAMANFWCSRPISYPERVNGVRTGRILKKTISYDEYIYFLNRLYGNLSSLVLRGFYESQVNSFKYFDNVWNGIVNLFSYYPNIFYELPNSMSEEEWNESKFDDFFSTFDFGYKSFYHDGFINTSIYDFVKNNPLQRAFRTKIAYDLLDSQKNKKYNEKFIVEL